MELKKLREFINTLDKKRGLVEKTKSKCENPLRYLELKAHCDTMRIISCDLEDLYIEESNKQLNFEK